MKQFGKILKFELKNYFTNKIFVGITLVLVAVIGVVMFFPRITAGFNETEQENTDNAELPIMLIAGDSSETTAVLSDAFSAAFSDYEVVPAEMSVEEIKEEIVSGNAECAFLVKNPTSYIYYVDNLSMYDMNTSIADELLQSLYRTNAMIENGIAPEAVGDILSKTVEHETESLGKDQMQNFFYTYIMIFALYMVILLYGQMVATNVATEKSSRAMEVLITSAKPVSMMFGKVIASCTAGFVQLVSVFGSALIFYNLNKRYWGENEIIASIFDMPLDLFVCMLIFFVLGFLMYAFMFGAIGSTASKLEDINTSVMPVTLIFIVGFLVVMMSMANGNIDTLLMKICSYIPFTSPMAMFTRIAMSTVPLYEIFISVALLIISVIAVGFVSAKIYRIGVLLYGTPPKLSAIIKAIKKA